MCAFAHLAAAHGNDDALYLDAHIFLKTKFVINLECFRTSFLDFLAHSLQTFP
jgi:hypothetical protein